MDSESTKHEESHYTSAAGTNAGERVTWVGIFGSLALIILEVWAGIVSKSHALIADAVHSFSDLISGFVVLLGFRWSRKEADLDHPYGHARIDTISSMVVGIVLVLVGGAIAYSAVMSIYRHETSHPNILAICAAGFGVILKEALFWYTIVVARRLRSAVLAASAWHHRSDALSSVAVLIGVGAAYINPNWHLADAFAALVVTFLIGKVGVSLVWDAFKKLSDIAPDAETVARITQVAEAVDGVRQVHDVRARFSGPQIFVELDVVVEPQLTVRDGHDIALQVKERLLQAFSDVTRVKIHVDPYVKAEDPGQ